MKAKLRLDKAAVQEFLIQNVEKIVFGILAIVFLFLVYSAWARVPRFDKTRDQLIAAVKTGQAELDRPPPKSDLVVQNYDGQAKRNQTAIDGKLYSDMAELSRPIFKKPPLREKPELYAAQDLRGTAGLGSVQMKAEAAAPGPAADADPRRTGPPPGAGTGGIESRGQQWIVITGLVPIGKEERAFDELRSSGPANSYDSTRDYPEYLGYSVQRVEVASPADAANPNWDKAVTILSGKAEAAANKQWGQVANNDVVAIQYITQRGNAKKPRCLVFPLPPLSAGGSWDASVAHPDEIPIQNTTPVGVPGRFGQGMPPPGANRLPPGQGDARPPAARPEPGQGGGDAGPSEESPYGDEPTPTGPSGRAAPNLGPNAQAGPPTNLLFRFFDLNVTPGKKYVYRVQLGLRNPNFALKASLLKDPTSADDRVLTTNWSDPTPVISVPSDTRIFAVSVKAGRDLVGRILITKWVRKQGLEAHQEFSVLRGQLADFPGETFEPSTRVPAARTPPMGGGPPPPGGARTRPTPDPRGGRTPPGPPPGPRQPFRPPVAVANVPFNVDYVTHAIALDFRGGERLHGRKSSSLGLAAPGEILILDSDGTLAVHDELDDKPACDQITGAEDAEATAGADAAPTGVRPGTAGRGAFDKMFNRDGAPKKRSSSRGDR